MKILIILGGFFPGKKYGGPPVSVENFCSLIKNDAECYIVTSNHDMGDMIPYDSISKGWNNRGIIKVLYLSDEEYRYNSFAKIIDEIQPDYLYLQGLFQYCVLPCLRLGKKKKVKIVLATRGELCSGAFKKKYKKIPYILYLRMMRLLSGVVFQSTSEEESRAIKKYLGAPPNRIYLLNNIPSLPSYLPEYHLKEPGYGNLVFISRIHRKKNLLEAINFLKTIKGEVKFDIYGPIEDESYWQQCTETIETLPQNVKIEYKGVLGHESIHKTFRQYDAFLFPTLSENYGHVIAEALLSGCLPIISDQTPWNDMNDAEAGWALSLDDPQGFKRVIQEVVDMDDEAICKKRCKIELYLNVKLKLDQLKADYLMVFKK